MESLPLSLHMGMFGLLNTHGNLLMEPWGREGKREECSWLPLAQPYPKEKEGLHGADALRTSSLPLCWWGASLCQPQETDQVVGYLVSGT